MKLEVLVTGKSVENKLQKIGYKHNIEKDNWYYRVIFPIKDNQQINNILKKLDSILLNEAHILNTSIVSDQDYLKLPYDYRIFFAGTKNKPTPKEKDIVLKKGLSFGAYHPTTFMCIELLMSLLLEHNIQGKVLDLGTGSGILAIIASKLGIKDIYAVDIDIQSCIEARNNAIINRCDDKIKVIYGNEQSIKGEFSLIMANIIFHTLETIIKDIISLLLPKGYLIISGFLSPDSEKFTHLLGKDGIILDIKKKEGWAAILWQKK